jgi:NitT/TauT family transport system permease protein
MTTIAAPSEAAIRGTRPLAALRRIFPHLAVFACVLLVWQIAADTGLINAFLLPPPTKVGAAIAEIYLIDGIIYWPFLITLYEAVAGFAIGAGIGVSLAVASSLSGIFRRYFSPYAIVLNVTPGLALTPIIIAWFGFGLSSKIALAAILCFFPVFVNTLTGLLNVDQERAEMFRALGANRFQTFWKLQVPSALPVAMAGFKIGMTTALVGAVVAEFTQASVGVGVLMNRFSFQLDMASAIAALLSMSLMGLLLFSAMEVLDDRLVFWRRDERMTAVGRRRKAAWRSGRAST